MESPLVEDEDDMELKRKARGFFSAGEHNKALEIYEDLVLGYEEIEHVWWAFAQQGDILLDLVKKTENPDVKFTYLLGSVECFWESDLVSPLCAYSLYHMAQHLGSVLYYKKCVDKAKEGLSLILPDNSDSSVLMSLEVQKLMNKKSEGMEFLLKDAEETMAALRISAIKYCDPKVLESKKSPEPLKDERKALKSFWVGLDLKTKREFLIVSIAKLMDFVEQKHDREGRDALEEVLAFAKKHRKWTFWICRTICSKMLFSAQDCKAHLERKHSADFEPSLEKYMVKRIGKAWAHKISAGGWEPVDTVAAVEMITNRLEDVKGFAPKNGWSKEWPLAADEKRSKLLKNIGKLLVSLCEHKILSCSIRDWMMRFPASHLGKFEVSKQTLVDIHLAESPQSICFLESHELSQILCFLKRIKCKRNDGTDQVSRAVDSVLSRTSVKEKIDFDPDFSFLLLDRRLLKSYYAPIDDEGRINVFDPNVHYSKAHAQGDDFISWLVDYSSVDKIFPRPIREQNLDMWVAVMKAIQFTCRTLKTKYAKKALVVDYEKALTSVENFCMSEDKRRMNLGGGQWNRYASLLCNICEEMGNSPTTRSFLCAVRDVLEGTWHPTFDFLGLENCLDLIRERKSLSDDIVLKSKDLLKSVATQKVLLIDSKILLIDNSRISLLNNLARLSVFDNRSYVLQVLKPFLLNEIYNMQAKAESDAIEADLLREQVKSQLKKKKNINKVFKALNSQQGTSTSVSGPLDNEPSTNLEPKDTSPSRKTMEDGVDGSIFDMSKRKPKSKKKKNKSIKGTSTSVSSTLDKIVEDEPSVSLEPEGTSPLLKTEGEDSMEPEGFLASERDSVENSPNTENLDESTKTGHDIKNFPGEDSLSEHLEPALVEAAARYNSALDMTLKAVLNITVFKEELKQNRHACQDNLEEQVPCALQNLFSAFLSEEIESEGVYSLLLSDFLASLEVVHPVSSGAAEVLVAILEFWHCWKNRKRESLVTRLFTLEGNERVRCSNCRRMSNYPEETSYGIVVGADSIRDLKCALGSRDFVDIIKAICLEYEMLCDIKTGGCGRTNIVQHTINSLPPIFTIVLEWKKSKTEEEISETTKALEWEIDISRLYEGLERNTNYRLVSMVGCGEKEEHICIRYEKKRRRWVNLRRESLEAEVVGKWESVVGFCGERKVRPEILFYEATRSIA